ncbi:MAG: exopolyphosphatase [Pseudomonadota bacterium]|nr:exopolyphosphatase [Pseudomonadota bacterium]
MSEHSVLAAVDLGSNSFRLQVSRLVDGQFYPLDALKESVRLGAGLGPDKMVDDASWARAIACLKRFGERLRGFQPDAVRAVGTNTLRVAKNAPLLLAQAEAALGFPIEVIAGHEEARLIYIGVAHAMPRSADRRLVVDIGGGSTELIIGSRFKPSRLESLYMGCVSHTRRFFPDGRLTSKAMKAAELAAASELQTIRSEFESGSWQQAIGSSGTARAIAEVLEQHGGAPGQISLEGLERARELTLAAGDIRRLALPGLREDRVPVFAGGLAIMASVFRELGVTAMTTTDSGLREGVLYDMLGRFEHKDAREATVRQMMRRYHVDLAQAARVESLALQLYREVRGDGADETELQFLSWAARLHEMGLSIAYSGYHKHSSYIVEHADMPGFSRSDQLQMALLLLAQRGGMPKVFPLVKRDSDWLLILCLRLAVLFHRGRADLTLPHLCIRARPEGWSVELDAAWCQANALTQANLESEQDGWSGGPKVLRIKRLRFERA